MGKVSINYEDNRSSYGYVMAMAMAMAMAVAAAINNF